MNAKAMVMRSALILTLLLICNGLHVQGRVPVAPAHHHARATKGQIMNNKHTYLLYRGGQAPLAAATAADIAKRGSLPIVKNLVKVFASVVDPAISGGLLSGGLHAITGT